MPLTPAGRVCSASNSRQREEEGEHEPAGLQKTRLLYKDEQTKDHPFAALAGALLVELDRIGHHRPGKQKRAPVLDSPYRHMNGYMSQAASEGKKSGSTQQAAFIPSAIRQCQGLAPPVRHQGPQRRADDARYRAAYRIKRADELAGLWWRTWVR